MVTRRHRQFQTDLSKRHLDTVSLNKKLSEFKESPASYSGLEERKVSATQTAPLASFLSRLG